MQLNRVNTSASDFAGQTLFPNLFMIQMLIWLTFLLLATRLTDVQAPEPVFNYDEAKVGTVRMN